MTKERLLKGARILGSLWNAGERCAEGWKVCPMDVDPAYAGAGCACDPKNNFCGAKRRWLAVAQEADRQISEDEFGLIVSMTGSEWDASGRTVKFDIPGVGVVSVGPKGQIPRGEMVRLTPDTLPSMLRIMKFFPGSRLEDVVFDDAAALPENQFPENGEVRETPDEAR